MGSEIERIQTFERQHSISASKERLGENQEIAKFKVICFAEPEAWNLIRDMIVQVEIIIFYLINTKCFIFKS